MRPAVFAKPPAAVFRIRPGDEADLAALNTVIERAIMTWKTPERVKRLSLASFRYQTHDLALLRIVVAESGNRAIAGVAAWGAARTCDGPAGQRGLLLHGLYVDPAYARRGVGGCLLEAAMQAAREQNFDGLLVKAQPEAAGFFAARGMRPLPVRDATRDYPYRYWWATTPGA